MVGRAPTMGFSIERESEKDGERRSEKTTNTSVNQTTMKEEGKVSEMRMRREEEW